MVPGQQRHGPGTGRPAPGPGPRPHGPGAGHLHPAGAAGAAEPGPPLGGADGLLPALHHSVAGAVHHPAHHPGHPDPGSAQRGGGPDHLRGGAAGPRRPGRLRLRGRGRQPGRRGHGLQAAGPVPPGGPAAVPAGDVRRAAGGLGQQHLAGQRGGAPGHRKPGHALHRRTAAGLRHGNRGGDRRHPGPRPADGCPPGPAGTAPHAVGAGRNSRRRNRPDTTPDDPTAGPATADAGPRRLAQPKTGGGNA